MGFFFVLSFIFFFCSRFSSRRRPSATGRRCNWRPERCEPINSTSVAPTKRSRRPNRTSAAPSTKAQTARWLVVADRCSTTNSLIWMGVGGIISFCLFFFFYFAFLSECHSRLNSIKLGTHWLLSKKKELREKTTFSTRIHSFLIAAFRQSPNPSPSIYSTDDIILVMTFVFFYSIGMLSSILLRLSSAIDSVKLSWNKKNPFAVRPVGFSKKKRFHFYSDHFSIFFLDLYALRMRMWCDPRYKYAFTFTLLFQSILSFMIPQLNLIASYRIKKNEKIS